MVGVLYEFKDLIDPRKLPRRRKELHYYVAGFIDGEGCFSVSVKRQKNARFGWVIDPVFHVVQKKENRIILEIIKRVLGCGRIIEKPGDDTQYQFIVDNRRQLKEKIIPFFERYWLITKHERFQKFAEIVNDLEQRKHWTRTGFIELLNKAYEFSDKRKYSLEEILDSLK